MDKFPREVEIVIALGYKGDLLKQFLLCAYPDRTLTFVDVDKFEGEGSGLGYTILQCKKFLQCPFVFCANDTIILEDVPEPTENWIGISYITDTTNYRTVSLKDDNVMSLNEKGTPGIGLLPYIGLAGIADHEIFWNEMESGRNYGSITEGESYGLKVLISEESVTVKEFSWFDIGSIAQLKTAEEYFRTQNSPNILPKVGEAIWFVDKKVIKYSADTEFIYKRVARAKTLAGFVPEIINSLDNIYVYREVAGQTLAKTCNAAIFINFLNFMKGLWKPVGNQNIKSQCQAFYKEKTLERIQQYFNRFTDQTDSRETINGITIPKIETIIDKLDWKMICDGCPRQIHGDLHFENILLTETGEFVLLDWRQDFAGQDSFDIYYDLAKLLHGLIISHEMVRQNQFTYSEENNIINIDIPISFKLLELQQILKRFVIREDLSWDKVKILTAIVFLNCAPLHEEIYGKFLFHLGKYLLWRDMDSPC
jgi:dTDP-glucose pyrophosphorylase